MKKVAVASGLFALSLSFTAQSQTETVPHCATSHMQERALQMFPNMADSLAKWELTANNVGIQEKASKTFPIVFHIIHTYDGNWVTDAQVHNAMAIINQDYQGLNTDLSSVITTFQSVVNNPSFEFRLARKDPQGNCTNGITRTFSRHTLYGDDDVKTIAPQWDPSRYINVWIVSSISNGAGGYAYLPGSAAFMPGRDGIILRSTQFGSIGFSNNSGLAKRSLTHELGHYFNLSHTWGGSNTPGLASNCNDDDNVSDTPNTIGTASQNCNTAQNTCNSLDNVQNIMDYSSCPIMFTTGQSNRMTAAANSSTANRNNLSANANLNFTGTNNGYNDTICVPLADFHLSNRVACVGTNVQLKDFTTRGLVATYNWEVTSGNTTLTSTQQNPTFNFTTPGIYTVKLTVTNSKGSNSKTKANYIKITANQAEIGSNGYYDDFENSPITSNRWYAFNEDNFGWTENSQAAVSGTKSLKITGRSQDSLATSTLYSPSFDLSQVSNATINFKYAYVRRNNNSNCRLRVSVSVNCGQTWNLIGSISAANLSSASNTSANFVPTSAQWKDGSFAIPSTYKNSSNLRIRFEFVAGNGNNFYFDDFNIPGSASTQEEVNMSNSLSIYPNPNSGSFQVSMDLDKGGASTFKLIDMTGKTVWINQTNVIAGQANYPIQTTGLSTGVYWLNIQTPSGIMIEKLVIQ